MSTSLPVYLIRSALIPTRNAIIVFVIIKSTASKTPGSIPAINNLGTDMLMEHLYTIISMLGRIIGPRAPSPEAVDRV